jgi:hypothetical protein
VFRITSVVLTHDGLDCLRRFIGVIKGDSADEVMENMGLHDAMQQSSSDEAKFSINGRRSPSSISPCGGRVMGKGGVSVLEEGDGNCITSAW